MRKEYRDLVLRKEFIMKTLQLNGFCVCDEQYTCIEEPPSEPEDAVDNDGFLLQDYQLANE